MGHLDDILLCPTCHEHLPADADPRRIYCSTRCRKHMVDIRRYGKPTLWVKRCGGAV